MSWKHEIIKLLFIIPLLSAAFYLFDWNLNVFGGIILMLWADNIKDIKPGSAE